jgi:RHS repeat-associated protein
LLQKEFSISGFEPSTGSGQGGEYIVDEVVDSFVYQTSSTYFCRVLGQKQYQMSNHLGNVLATVLDRRTGVFDLTEDTLLYYTADVVNSKVYYPFGKSMLSYSYPEFSFAYSFNGMERDDETGLTDFGARFYSEDYGRFLGLDPLMSHYPSLTPYHGIGNNPILFIDADGKKILLPYRTDDQAEWGKFKAIVENRFDGMVSISRKRIETGRSKTEMQNGKPVTIKEEYWEVQLNLNDNAIHNEAIKRLEMTGNDFTPDLITQEKEKIKKELENDNAFHTLDKMVSSDINARFNLYSNGFGIARFAGESSGVQQINIDLISQISMYKGSKFNVLYHELVEGHEYASQKKLGGDISYGHSHLKAIEAQVIDMNISNKSQVLWVNIDLAPSSNSDSPILNQRDYNLEVTVFYKENNQYFKSVGALNINNGQAGGATFSTPEKLSKSQFNKEKKDYENKVK